jgi:nitrate/nitrite transporter NarK
MVRRLPGEKKRVYHYMTPDIPQDMADIKSHRVANVSLILLCLSFQTISLSGVALFLPIILKDLGLSFTQGGTISAAAMFVYALMQIPAGYVADRYGLKKLFFIGVLGTTVFCFAFGLVVSYWDALIYQTISGFFRAFVFASGVALLASWFAPKRRATAMGLSLIGLFSGQLIINTCGPLLLEQFNWRFPFIAFASVGILSSFGYLWFSKNSPLEVSGRKADIMDVIQLFRYPFMWVVGVIQFVRLGIYNSLSFWLPTLFINEKGLSLQVTGLIIALRTILSAPTNIVGGYMSDRLKAPTGVMAVSLIMIAVTTALLVRVNEFMMLITLNVINALFVQLYFGPLFAIPVERYGSQMTGTLTGFGNFFANLGSFSFTYLLGFVKDRTGYFESGFYIIAAACLVSLVFTMLLKHMKANPDKPELTIDY